MKLVNVRIKSKEELEKNLEVTLNTLKEYLLLKEIEPFKNACMKKIEDIANQIITIKYNGIQRAYSTLNLKYNSIDADDILGAV